MNIVANILGRTAVALGYDMGSSSHARRDLGWGKRTPIDEDSAVVPDNTRELMRQKCIDAIRNNPIAAGVCQRIASFAVGPTGLLPQAMTSDDKWNDLAQDWWNYDFGQRCDSRGRLSMHQLQWQTVSLRPVMGGLYWQCLEDGTFRPVEPERIRDPQNTKQAREEGYVDGVRVDPLTGVIRGYMVHARDRDGTFGGKRTEQYVPAENMIPAIRPPWRPDMVREIPDFAPLGNAMQDVFEANSYTLNTMKTQSKPVASITRNGGAGINSGPRGTAGETAGERKRFQMDSLEVLMLNNGEQMNMTSSPTPGANHIPYMQMQYGLMSAGIDYPYEFYTLDFTKCDYSRMKAVLLLVNKASRNWQAWLKEVLYRAWVWRVAMAIERKELPPAPLGMDGRSEWNLVDWQAPEELWIDRQESAQADLMEWQMRQGSLSEFARRRGKCLEDTLRAQARDMKLVERIEIEEGIPAGSLKPQMQIPGQTAEQTPTQREAEKDAVPKKKDGAADE
jgi:capsid protein